MKYKAIFILFFIIIMSSLTLVSATDLNETAETTSDDDMLTYESDETNSELENVEEESILKDGASSDSTENPTYGIVDFGSNSINLEIYELNENGEINSVFDISRKSVTSQYVEDGNLTDTGKKELKSILEDYNSVMDLVGVKTKYVFATASLRKVNNSQEVIDYIKEKVGLEIHLLSGDKEAMTSFNAIKDSELTEDDGIVIDLGGGSCEVIEFKNKTIINESSMPFGSNSLYKDYVSYIFPNETERASIENMVLEELKKTEIKNDTKKDLFTIGGTGKTMRKVMVSLGLIDSKEYSFEVSKLDDFLNQFKDVTKENFELLLDINAEKINTLIPGVIAIKSIADYYNVSYIHVCKNGIREGIVAEIIQNESNESSAISTVISASDVNTAYNAGKYITATIKDIEGNPLSNIRLTVTLNGKTLTPVSDLKGQVKIATSNLVPKTYSVIISFNGNDNFTKSTKTVKLTVKKATPKLKAKKATFKVKTKTKKYKIRLKANNKALAKTKVKLKVKGKTYTAKTNSKGKATFKITKLKKKGKFNAIAKFNGNKYYNKISKKVKIKVKK